MSLGFLFLFTPTISVLVKRPRFNGLSEYYGFELSSNGPMCVLQPLSETKLIVSHAARITQGAIAKDPKTPEKEKEACLAFVDAESRLDKEDS